MGAAKRYEELNDVKVKMKRMEIVGLPKAWKDPKSVRKGRPAELQSGSEFSEWAPPQYKGANELKSYQVEGVRWMIYNWHMKRNCILADEMVYNNFYIFKFFRSFFNVCFFNKYFSFLGKF